MGSELVKYYGGEKVMIQHSYNFRWRGRACVGGVFSSHDQMLKSFRKALDDIGYYPPKWWEFWRWSEVLPAPYQKSKKGGTLLIWGQNP